MKSDADLKTLFNFVKCLAYMTNGVAYPIKISKENVLNGTRKNKPIERMV